MSDKKNDHENLSKINSINDYSIPPMSDDQLRLWLQNSPIISTLSMEDLQEKVSPFSENPSFEDIILHNFDNNQSGGTEGRRGPGPDHFHADMQTNERDAKEQEVGGKMDSECQQLKRKRSSKVNNLNNKIRRQNLAKKMKALQEMIPNSEKRDKASTLDEAMKYIQTLQYQLQVMSAGIGYTMFHSPMMMMPPQLGQQGMPIPSFPMNQLRIPNPCLTSSSSARPIQNRGNFLGPLYTNSFPYFGSQSNKQGETSSSQDGKTQKS